jgi:hypothetical protein
MMRARRLLQRLLVNEAKAFAFLRSMVNYLEGVARAYANKHGIRVPVLHAGKKVIGPEAFSDGLQAPPVARDHSADVSTKAAAAAARPSPTASAKSAVKTSTGAGRPRGAGARVTGPRVAAVRQRVDAGATVDSIDEDDYDYSDDDEDEAAVYAMTYDDNDGHANNGDGDGDGGNDDDQKGSAYNTSFESNLHQCITRLVFKLAEVGFDETFAVAAAADVKDKKGSAGVVPAWLTKQFWVISSEATSGAAVTTVWLLIRDSMAWAKVREQQGFMKNLTGFTEALREPEELHGLHVQAAGMQLPRRVLLPRGHSIQQITQSLVKLAGCRVLARAKSCAKRLQTLKTVHFFEWLSVSACEMGDLAVCATTALAAASAALNVGGGVKRVTDLLAAETDECRAFRRNPSVRTCLAAHNDELRRAVAAVTTAGHVVNDTVDGVACLVSCLLGEIAALQETLRTRRVAELTKSTRLDAALAVLMEKRDATWGRTVLPPPTEALKVLHAPVDWARIHGLCSEVLASRGGVYDGQLGCQSDVVYDKRVNGVLARTAVLECILSTEEVDRVMARGGSCIGFSSDGLTLNLRVERTVPATTASASSSTALVGAKSAALPRAGPGVDGAGVCAHTGPALDQTCALANVRTMTPAARTLLGDGALTRIPFVAVGATVFAKCNGDFTALTLAQRLHVGDIALVCAGVDPTRPGRYSETMLRYPLAQGPSPPATRQRHIWLLACLREHDRRFAVSCDPGISSPLCFVDTALVHDAVTRTANRERRRDGDKRRYHMKQVETYRPRAQRGCIHRAYVPLSVLADAVDVVRRPGDPWGVSDLLLHAHRGVTRRPDCPTTKPNSSSSNATTSCVCTTIHCWHNAGSGNSTVGQHDGADHRRARCKRGPPVRGRLVPASCRGAAWTFWPAAGRRAPARARCIDARPVRAGERR